MATTYDIIEKKAITLSEVKKKLEEKEELNYRENRLVDYFKKLNIVDSNKVEELKKELLELGINRLDEEDVVKIINIMPKTGTELRAIVSSTGTILIDESVQKILEVLNKYR